MTNCRQCLGQRLAAARDDLQSRNGHARFGDAALTPNDFAIRPRGFQVDVGERGGEDLTTDCQHFAAKSHRLSEVMSKIGERGEKEIAKIVAAQTVAAGEAVIEELSEKLFVL